MKVKGTGPRRPHAYKADPDFSSLPILPPSPKAGPGGNSSAPEQKVQKHPSSIPVTYFPATPARDGPFIPSPCAKDIASRQMLLPSCAHHMAENQNFRHFDMGSVSCFPQSLAIESFAPPATLLMMRQQAMLQNFALPSALSVEAMNQISTLQIIAARRRAALTLQANSMMQDRRTDLHQRSVSEKRRLMASMLDEALLI